MHNPILAKRYADALYQLAAEQDRLDEVIQDLSVVKIVLKHNPDLIDLLDHPNIHKQEKATIIESAFANISEDVVHTIRLLVERKRTDLMIPMIDMVKEQCDRESGLARIDVTTTKSLTDAQTEQLIETFKKRLNKTDVSLNEIIDPSVLGGIKIRFGNRVYDGTVKNNLNRLERSFQLNE